MLQMGRWVQQYHIPVLICSYKTLTMEEYSFLEEYGVNDEDGFSESQSMAWSTGEEPGGMGDEAEAAYEEFLRLQS